MFKKLFCKHKFKRINPIYGDAIIALSWNRSIWECNKCGKVKYSKHLYKIV